MEAKVGPEKYAGRSGEAEWLVRKTKGRRARAEAGKLDPIERMVRLIATGEVAHHQRRRHSGKTAGLPRQALDFVRPKAKAIDARVDVDCRGAAGSRVFPPRDL